MISCSGLRSRCSRSRQRSRFSGPALVERKLADDQFVQAVIDQAQRHFVDRKILVFFFDDGLDGHVAEERDLRPIVARERAFGAADQNVGLDTDLPQQADRMLRGLGFQFGGGLQIRHEREVDIEAVFLALIERKLADGFEERLAFDIAHRAADFGDDDIDILAGGLVQRVFDFVRDVRNDLHGLAEEFAAAFLVDDREVDLAGGEIRIAIEDAVGESFVVAEIEVGFAAVVEHIDFAVLVGAHRARIDVDVRIELLHADGQPALFEQHADRSAGQSLAERTNDAAGHEDMFGHGRVFSLQFSVYSFQFSRDRAPTGGWSRERVTNSI